MGLSKKKVDQILARYDHPKHQKRLPADVKERWLRALESGEYKKGRNSLRVYDEAREEESFCCLGVLADEEIDGEWDGSRLRSASGFFSNTLAVVGGSGTVLGLLRRTKLNLAGINDMTDDFQVVCAYIRRYL